MVVVVLPGPGGGQGRIGGERLSKVPESNKGVGGTGAGGGLKDAQGRGEWSMQNAL